MCGIWGRCGRKVTSVGDDTSAWRPSWENKDPVFEYAALKTGYLRLGSASSTQLDNTHRHIEKASRQKLAAKEVAHLTAHSTRVPENEFFFLKKIENFLGNSETWTFCQAKQLSVT